MNTMMTRKEFLKWIGLSGAACLLPAPGYGLEQPRGKSVEGHVFKDDAPEELWKWSREGRYYTAHGSRVQCQICPNRCVLAPGDRSICRSKVNMDGKLFSLTYGNPCTIHVDPVEKKPLNHFYPRSRVLSIATTGCNFRCLNCQNWEISQRKLEEVRFTELFPEAVVQKAVQQGTPSIAYTYSEPVTFYEYMVDTARLAREAGLKNILVSNGFINHEPLMRLCETIDAANINLKAFDDNIYRCLNGGRLRPVLDTFKDLHRAGVWFEITTLVVPTYVDKPETIRRMCGWILETLGPDYPLHLLRFFPRYRLTRLPATPVETLENLRELAIGEGLHYVFIGNAPGHQGTHTYCPNCHELLIERQGYHIAQYNLEHGRCRFCNAPISGRWEE